MKRSILSQNQRTILHILRLQPTIRNSFYFSGGTALAEYYLHHRYSEDLDFFSFSEIDTESIISFFQSQKRSIGFTSMDLQQSFNRNLFFFHFSGDIVKMEFTYYPFTQIEQPKNEDGIRVDSLIDIAVNKTFTIYQKPRSRDFIDLYCILYQQKWSFSDMRKKARVKFDTHMDPLQMAQHLLEVGTVLDYPRLLLPLYPEEWIQFWKQEAMKLKSEAVRF